MTASQCLKCGEATVHQRRVDFVVERAGRGRIVSDGRMVCASCGNVSYEGHQISEHERARAAAYRDLDGLLSPSELFDIRMKTRLTPADLERMLSIGPKTWLRWERGKIPQNKEADTLIRLIADEAGVALGLTPQARGNDAETDATFHAIDDQMRTGMDHEASALASRSAVASSTRNK